MSSAVRNKFLPLIFILLFLGMAGCGLIRDLFFPFGNIDWYSSLEKAMNAEGDRPILLFFHSEFECPYCQRVIAVILPNPEFVEKTRHFRCVHYNIHEADRELIRRYRINAHPAFLIVDGSGNVMDKLTGFNLKGTLALLERHIK
ncbi:MAG: thioredoxin fold domain-containing protein [bacterium]